MVQVFKYGLFEIELKNDEMYKRNSTDNKNVYDFEYINKTNADSLTSKYGINVFLNGCTYKSVILMAGGGGITAVSHNSALIDEDNFIIVIGNSTFSLNLPDLTLKWVMECDDSLCFGVYKIPDGYVIHGELAITKISLSGVIEWQFYGRDIFVTPDGLDNFNISVDKITVRDWEKCIYNIDFSGNEIK